MMNFKKIADTSFTLVIIIAVMTVIRFNMSREIEPRLKILDVLVAAD